MKISPTTHYSLNQLVEMGAFPNVSQTTSLYIRFIGTQATLGNVLSRDTKAFSKNGHQPFKGADVIKFINNIK